MPLPEWQDRRALFQKGREVHEPGSPTGRRMSESSITDVLTRTTSNQSSGTNAAATTSPTSPQSPNAAKKPAVGATGSSPSMYGSAGQRRRSSAASNSGMFGNLMGLKRGSEDYNQRRGSIEEMEGKSGMFGGMWNSTFRGMQNKPKSPTQEPKRGVME